MSDYQQQTESAISDARGIFSALFDEDMPNLSGSFEDRDAANDRLILGMKLLDEASDRLQEFGWQADNLNDVATNRANQIEELELQVNAAGATTFAEELLHELRGRMTTDSPKAVVWWIESALERIAYADAPTDADEASTLLIEATRIGG